MKYVLIVLLFLPLLLAGQDMRLYPTVRDLSTFEGDYAWYNLGFWQKKAGTVTTKTPGYNQTVMAGPTGFYFEKAGALIRPGGELWVEDFRAAGDSDADVWDKAIKAMEALRIPLRAGGREYIFDRTVIVDNEYWHVIGSGNLYLGTVIKSAINGFGAIRDTPVAPDLSYPTLTNPGPMRGCAFYFTKTFYYSRTERLTFFDFRFAMAFLVTHNSPTFQSCMFGYGNVGVICYQGSQNYQYINCTTSGDILHISSATCFPADSPYAQKSSSIPNGVEIQDGYYTDGLAVKNEGGYGSFSGCHTGNYTCAINPNFDAWFVASILRPSVVSYVYDRSGYTYSDKDGNVYPSTSPYCAPSGRVVYVPMRHPRAIFGTQFRNVDARGSFPRGFCLLNEHVVNLNISGQINFEGMFQNNTDSTGYFTLGSVHNGQVDGPFTNLGYIETSHPLIAYTGRGFSDGHAEFSNKLDRPWTPEDLDREYIGKVKRTPVNNSAYTVQPEDYIVAYVNLSAPQTVYLPPASTMNGRSITLKDETGKAGANAITLTFASTASTNNTIDGEKSKVLNTNYGTLKVYSNGQKWFTH